MPKERIHSQPKVDLSAHDLPQELKSLFRFDSSRFQEVQIEKNQSIGPNALPTTAKIRLFLLCGQFYL